MKSPAENSVVRIVLVVLGVLFLLAVLAVVAFFAWIAIDRPLGVDVRSIPGAVINSENQSGEASDASGNENGSVGSVDRHPVLTDEQEEFVESLGIDPAVLPDSLSEEQIQCFTTQLGEDRINEILNGAMPTASDVFKVSGCL